jgi:guanylate kinase
MSEPNLGILIVVSGPAGSGKGTVTKLLAEEKSDTAALTTSYTTRQPREGERHGREYFFTDRDTFRQMIANDEILEHTEYDGNLYGTPVSEVKRLTAEGKDIILEIEVDGAMQIKKIFPDSVTVMLIPPDFITLEKRLRGRNTETEDSVIKRLNRAKKEIPFAYDYDYIVVNRDGMESACVGKINDIISAEHHKSSRRADIIENFFKSE